MNLSRAKVVNYFYIQNSSAIYFECLMFLHSSKGLFMAWLAWFVGSLAWFVGSLAWLAWFVGLGWAFAALCGLDLTR